MASKFVNSLEKRLLASPGSVILPEGDDPRTIDAAKLCIENKIATKILIIGSQESVATYAEEPSLAGHVTNNKIEFICSEDSLLIENTKNHVLKQLEKRNKQISEEKLLQMSGSPHHQAAFMLADGKAEACVAGAVYTTADVIRAGLTGVGLKSGMRTVSSSFLMNRDQDQKTFIYTDCGVVIEPTVDQLVDIAAASVETFTTLNHGLDPVVAFLSFSTKGSASHPSQQKMVEASKRFKDKFPTIESEGELQFDAAFDSSIGARKAPDSRVPGRANIFVFPNLDAGNIAYKITERLAGFEAFGPILQGLDKPYSDLSRGATPYDIYVSCLISIIRSRL